MADYLSVKENGTYLETQIPPKAGNILVDTGITFPVGNVQKSVFMSVPNGSGGGSGPPVINLASAVTYGVLGSSTVTNSGNTVVTGDLGLYPGTSVTGFPPGTVSGATNITNPAAHLATTDAQAAYTAGQALAGATVLSASTYELGSTTVTPGIYKIGSSATITGTVTLDAGGNANAFFIFQIGSTLLPQVSSVVSLTNGAQAKNVYWLVGSSATIGTSATFIGTVLADVSISVGTGASVVGHLLAPFTGAVTLLDNAVTATPAGSSSGGGVLTFNTRSGAVSLTNADTTAVADAGNATLVGGTVTVADTSIGAGSILIVTRKTIGGTTGNMSYTLNAGVGFTINSSSGTDTSVVSWFRAK